jgi:hypothetical protein
MNRFYAEYIVRNFCELTNRQIAEDLKISGALLNQYIWKLRNKKKLPPKKPLIAKVDLEKLPSYTGSRNNIIKMMWKNGLSHRAINCLMEIKLSKQRLHQIINKK